MIKLHERKLPTSVGFEPATSWSPVGRARNWAAEAGPASEEANGAESAVFVIYINNPDQVICLAES